MDYSTIQSRVAGYLDRTDLTTRIQGWINDERQALANDYNFDFLYVESTLSTSAGSATYALPDDFLGRETVLLGSKKLTRLGAREYEQVVGIKETLDPTVSYLTTTDGTLPTAEPDYYVDRGLYIDLFPTPDDTYTVTLKYYAQPTDFSDDTDEDYMSRIYSDVIVWGTVLRGAAFMDDTAKLQMYSPYYERAVKAMQKKERDKKSEDLGRRFKSYKDFDLAAFKRILKVSV